MTDSKFGELFEGSLRPVGTTVSGTIPVSERALNELASRGGKVSSVRILNGNNITLFVAGIPSQIDATIVSIDASLNLIIRLNGFLAWVALGLVSTFLARFLPEGVRSENGLLHVAVSKLPQVSAYRPVLRCLNSVAVETRTGYLTVKFNASIR